ncbi:MAG TPA: hypothetical protein VGM23_06710, partial [Armatimonadota bacterium]
MLSRLFVLCSLAILTLLGVAAAVPRFDDGMPRKFSRTFLLNEQLEQQYANELVTYAVQFPAGQARLASLRLWDDKAQQAMPFQLSDAVVKSGVLRSASVSFWVDSLAKSESRTYTLWWDKSAQCKVASFPPAAITEATTAHGVEVASAQYSLRFAGNAVYQPALPADKAPGALLAFKGADGVWRGKGYFQAEYPISKQSFSLLEAGPLWKTYRQRTEFANGDWHELTVKIFPHTDYARFSERSSYRGEVESWRRGDQFIGELAPAGYGPGGMKQAGQFVFSLRENFDPDINYSPATFSRSLVQSTLTHEALKGYTLSWHIHPYWHNAWSAVYSSDPAVHDCLGVIATDAAHWSQAVAPLELLDDAAGHARMTMPLRVDRHYYLVFSTREKVVRTPDEVNATAHLSYSRYWGLNTTFVGKRISPSACYIWQMRNKLTDFPLNKIKDWVLDYDVLQDVHPRVLWDPKDQQLDEVTRRYNQIPDFKNFYKEGVVIEYLFTGKHGPNYPPEPGGNRLDWNFDDIEGYTRD